MFNQRSEQKELIDDLNLSNHELPKNLSEMEFFNHWLGSKTTMMDALNKIYDKYKLSITSRIVSIADLGCGNGELIRSIDVWAKKFNRKVKLTGIDANPSIIHYAKKLSNPESDIYYETIDIFSKTFLESQYDIVCLNNICHHFTDNQLVELISHLQKNTKFAIVINDLHRHFIAYYFIKHLSKLISLTTLAQNDGPLSVLKAFRKSELIRLISLANIHSYQIRWRWAFRWQVLIWCNKDSIA